MFEDGGSPQFREGSPRQLQRQSSMEVKKKETKLISSAIHTCYEFSGQYIGRFVAGKTTLEM
jgi:hypothetical protein